MANYDAVRIYDDGTICVYNESWRLDDPTSDDYLVAVRAVHDATTRILQQHAQHAVYVIEPGTIPNPPVDDRAELDEFTRTLATHYIPSGIANYATLGDAARRIAARNPVT